MEQIEKYGVFTLKLAPGKMGETPKVQFRQREECCSVAGFAMEGGAAVRFMPQREGVWGYSLVWNGEAVEGAFACVPSTGRNHGPVSAEGRGFRYADGTRFIPMGTTCYAWTHQTEELQEETLETLRTAPFNKLRMCVFPKSTQYNMNDPEHYPFLKNADGAWDTSRPDEAFWKNLERRIVQLGELGIEADLILFHPYDRWGFSQLSREENLAYLDYCVRRLSAFRNVWWSLSNEYDLVFSKTLEDWDAFGERVSMDDPYGHLISAHNWLEPYPKRDWMTHVSWQGSDMRKAFRLWAGYGLPVIVDELGYEGDIEFDWGNNSAFEIVNRMWTAAAFGCYCTHGETFFREDQVLWWSKGGKLHGQAPARIRFLREVLESIPGQLEPLCKDVMNDPAAMAKSPQHAELVKAIWDAKPPEIRQVFLNEFILPVSASADCRLHYFQRSCQAFTELRLPEGGSYDVELIDVWAMSRERVMTDVSGSLRVELPGREGTALLVTRRSGPELI